MTRLCGLHNTNFKAMEAINHLSYASEKFKPDMQVSHCAIFHSLLLSIRGKLLFVSRFLKNMPVVLCRCVSYYYTIVQAHGLNCPSISVATNLICIRLGLPVGSSDELTL